MEGKRRTVNRRTLPPHKQGFLKKIAPQSWETHDGRFAVWSPKAGTKCWFWFDSETGLQYETTERSLAIDQIQALLAGHPPAQSMPPTPRPAPAPALRLLPAPAPTPPAPKAEEQLDLGIRRQRIVKVILIEVDGRQVVVGFDASGNARTLWTEGS